MWRPPNFENPFAEGERLSSVVNADVKEYAFEAGADAMLKALASLPETPSLKRAKKAFGKPQKDKYGWLIYIPDELES